MGYPSKDYPTKNDWMRSAECLLPDMIKNSTQPYIYSTQTNLKRVIKTIDEISDPNLVKIRDLLQVHADNVARLHVTLDRLYKYAHDERRRISPNQKKEKQSHE